MKKMILTAAALAAALTVFGGPPPPPPHHHHDHGNSGVRLAAEIVGVVNNALAPRAVVVQPAPPPPRPVVVQPPPAPAPVPYYDYGWYNGFWVPCYSGSVSYTHLTLPTIYSV